MFEILPKLTKDYILSFISQEQIFERYLNVNNIDHLAANNILIHSPLRSSDENPSFGFKYVNGRLRAKDFSGYFWGDCFDLVAYDNNLMANDKSDFFKVLTIIAKEFRLHKYKGQQNHIYIPDRLVVQKDRTKLVIKIAIRDWNSSDGDYWNRKYQVSKRTLQKTDVYPCEYVWINNQCVYSYMKSDPAYGYFGGHDDNKIENWKIYYPFRKKNRFISNEACVEGWRNLEDADIVIITKSKKDTVVLKEFSLQAISPHSETHLLPKEIIEKLELRYEYIYSLMDFDRTGVAMANQLRKVYNIEPLFFTNGRFGSINYCVKDFSDYVEKYRKDKAIELINNIKNNVRSNYN